MNTHIRESISRPIRAHLTSNIRLSIEITAIILLALVPMFRSGLWAGHDMFHHLFRLVDLDIVLRGGTFYARWLPDLGFFYGYPVLNFYAPFAYYLSLLPHWLGTTFTLALKISYAASFFVAALGIYAWSRRFWSHTTALGVAIVYTFVPYHLANAYVRAALAEHWAQALMPWILFTVEHFRQDIQARNTTSSLLEKLQPDHLLLSPLMAISVALLTITHNLSAFIFLPFVVLYILLRTASLSRPSERTRFLVGTGTSIVTGILITAFYWLPALMEVGWIRAGVVGRHVTEQSSQLASLNELVSPYLLYRYYPHQGVPFEHPLSWWTVGGVALGGIAALARMHRLTREQRHILGITSFILFLAVVLMLDTTAVLWTHVPALAFIQFPWRLQTVLSLMVAMMIAPLLEAGLAFRPASKASYGQLALLSLILLFSALTALPFLPWERLTWPNGDIVKEDDLTFWGMAQYDYINGLFAREHGDPWLMEYLPITVKTPREDFWLPKPSGKVFSATYNRPTAIRLGRICPTRYQVEVTSEHPTFIRWHQFWFPGWQATIDGQAVPVIPSPELGLVTLPVPAGTHRITINFGSTGARQAGWILSLFGLYVFVLPFARGKRRHLLLLILAALLMWAALWAWENQSRSTCAEPRQELATVGPGNEVGFLGCTVNTSVSPSPQKVVTVTAYWLALRPISENWKAFVHVVNANGNVIAQHDAYPGENFSPTSRWETGEIVADYHTIRLPTPLPPGTQIRIGMYRFTDHLENLPMRTWSGENIGTSWQGTCVPSPQKR